MSAVGTGVLPDLARLQLARSAAEAVGRFCLARFEALEAIAIDEKGPADYASAVDRAAEALARRLILESFPSDAVIGEEEGGAPASAFWVIDPLDGTANFLSGLPFWAVSIGYVVAGRPLLGAVALPALGTIIAGGPGLELKVEGRLPRLTDRRLLAFGIGRNRVWPLEERTALEGLLEAQGLHIVSLGSCAASLAMVAAGRLAGYVENGVYLWDCAAGHALCLSAGKSSRIELLESDHQRLCVGAGLGEKYIKRP